jgi:hypothetical protein
MNPNGQGIVFLQWFIPLLLLAWVGLLASRSFLGGWNQLARRFGTSAAIEGEKFRFTSLSVGSGYFPVKYRNCMFVTVGQSGLALSVNILFRVFHPPLMIPWSDIETVQPEKVWLAPHIAVYVRGFDKRLLFRWNVGMKISDYFYAPAKASA